MSVRVRIPTILRTYTGGDPEVTAEGATLAEVLDNLESDHEFLTAGDVFTPDLIETWIDYKRSEEILPVQLRPHPHEFELYYDI